MRELKFRAWDEQEKRMLYSTESYDYGNTEFQFIDGELCVVRYSCGWNNFPIAEKAEGIKGMMQYTGLKDRNGQEVYEGDIVNNEDNETAVIVYDSGSFILQYPDSPLDFDSLFDFQDKELEIIGNIYENPELLEVENV
jgi:hypothetical protein